MLQFPVYVVLRTVDYDEENDAVNFSKGTPKLTVTYGDKGFWPIFTTSDLAMEFANEVGFKGKSVPCDKERLLRLILSDEQRREAACIDPAPTRDVEGLSRLYKIEPFIRWLASECGIDLSDFTTD